jgi:transcriptional regulator with XRE-family HTH domain
MTEASTFGQRVKQVRQRRKLSIQALARKSGIPYQTIWRLEVGRHQHPRIDLAVKLAQALGVSLDYLT